VCSRSNMALSMQVVCIRSLSGWKSSDSCKSETPNKLGLCDMAIVPAHVLSAFVGSGVDTPQMRLCGTIPAVHSALGRLPLTEKRTLSDRRVAGI
jgi:hypothetical protein